MKLLKEHFFTFSKFCTVYQSVKIAATSPVQTVPRVFVRRALTLSTRRRFKFCTNVT